jgi:hypothetical protein
MNEDKQKVIDMTVLSDKWRKFAIPSTELGKVLIEKGILPANTRRFLIDCEVGQAVKLYIETFPSGEDIDFTFAELLKLREKAGIPE